MKAGRVETPGPLVAFLLLQRERRFGALAVALELQDVLTGFELAGTVDERHGHRAFTAAHGHRVDDLLAGVANGQHEFAIPVAVGFGRPFGGVLGGAGVIQRDRIRGHAQLDRAFAVARRRFGNRLLRRARRDHQRGHCQRRCGGGATNPRGDVHHSNVFRRAPGINTVRVRMSVRASRFGPEAGGRRNVCVPHKNQWTGNRGLAEHRKMD